jgi:hypothetical protein
MHARIVVSLPARVMWVWLLPGVKHEFTDGMREEMFRFIWEEALVGEATVRRSAL